MEQITVPVLPGTLAEVIARPSSMIFGRSWSLVKDPDDWKMQTSHPSSGRARGMVHNAAKSDFSPWKNYAQILLGATNRCLKNKKVMENCQHASSQDEPHLTSHSFLG